MKLFTFSKTPAATLLKDDDDGNPPERRFSTDSEAAETMPSSAASSPAHQDTSSGDKTHQGTEQRTRRRKQVRNSIRGIAVSDHVINRSVSAGAADDNPRTASSDHRPRRGLGTRQQSMSAVDAMKPAKPKPKRTMPSSGLALFIDSRTPDPNDEDAEEMLEVRSCQILPAGVGRTTRKRPGGRKGAMSRSVSDHGPSPSENIGPSHEPTLAQIARAAKSKRTKSTTGIPPRLSSREMQRSQKSPSTSTELPTANSSSSLIGSDHDVKNPDSGDDSQEKATPISAGRVRKVRPAGAGLRHVPRSKSSTQLLPTTITTTCNPAEGICGDDATVNSSGGGMRTGRSKPPRSASGNKALRAGSVQGLLAPGGTRTSSPLPAQQRTVADTSPLFTDQDADLSAHRKKFDSGKMGKRGSGTADQNGISSKRGDSLGHGTLSGPGRRKVGTKNIGADARKEEGDGLCTAGAVLKRKSVTRPSLAGSRKHPSSSNISTGTQQLLSKPKPRKSKTDENLSASTAHSGRGRKGGEHARQRGRRRSQSPAKSGGAPKRAVSVQPGARNPSTFHGNGTGIRTFEPQPRPRSLSQGSDGAAEKGKSVDSSGLELNGDSTGGGPRTPEDATENNSKSKPKKTFFKGFGKLFARNHGDSDHKDQVEAKSSLSADTIALTEDISSSSNKQDGENLRSAGKPEESENLGGSSETKQNIACSRNDVRPSTGHELTTTSRAVPSSGDEQRRKTRRHSSQVTQSSNSKELLALDYSKTPNKNIEPKSTEKEQHKQRKVQKKPACKGPNKTGRQVKSKEHENMFDSKSSKHSGQHGKEQRGPRKDDHVGTADATEAPRTVPVLVGGIGKADVFTYYCWSSGVPQSAQLIEEERRSLEEYSRESLLKKALEIIEVAL